MQQSSFLFETPPRALKLPEDGEVLFMETPEREQCVCEWANAWILRIGPFRAADRGHLEERITAAIFAGAERRGLDRPTLAPTMMDTLSDLRAMASRSGFPSVVVLLESLASVTNHRNTLDGEDSRVLRDVLRSVQNGIVSMVSDPDNRSVEVFGPTVALSSLLPVTGSLPAVGFSTFVQQSARNEASHQETSDFPLDLGVTELSSDELEDDEEIDEGWSDEHTDRILPTMNLLDETDESTLGLMTARATLQVFASVNAPAVVIDSVVTELPWREWVAQLQNTRGPQSLAALEEKFVNAYAPLMSAVRAGQAGMEAQTALRTFGDNFARVYQEVFPMLGLRQKRPAMVMDALDLAHRAGRDAGARLVLPILVDAMRWDVGLSFEKILTAKFGEHTTRRPRRVLWSALPSTTPRQLETLAMGKDALRIDHSPVSEASMAKSRTTEVVRRVRVGSKEIFKLDVVESKLQTGQTDIEALAEVAAASIERFVTTYEKARQGSVLLYVFGDHGFGIESTHGEERARFGGAYPEQVLVPAQTWFIPSLH